VQVADTSGALYAVIGILMALLGRERTGEGGLVDIAMSDCAMSLNGMHAGQALLGGPHPRRGDMPLSGALPSYGVYRTGDGRHLALGALEPRFFQRFCSAVGRPDLAARQFSQDPAPLRGELQALFAQRTLAEWMALLGPADCCAAPVLDFAAAFSSENTAARGMVRDVAHPAGGTFRALATPLPAGGTPPCREDPPPRLGEHTDAVLREAGFSPEEISGLREAGAIG
jgi:crotonobetainyl-CoA:carnitine CoA-transferase CaiB-like acyl-CoA transferase